MTLKLPLLGTSIGWLFYASVEPEQVSQSSARAYPDDLDRPSATSLALSRREHGLGIEIFQCDGHLELSSWTGPRSKGSNTDLTPGATVESGPGEARKSLAPTVGYSYSNPSSRSRERANHFAHSRPRPRGKHQPNTGDTPATRKKQRRTDREKDSRPPPSRERDSSAREKHSLSPPSHETGKPGNRRRKTSPSRPNSRFPRPRAESKSRASHRGRGNQLPIGQPTQGMLRF